MKDKVITINIKVNFSNNKEVGDVEIDSTENVPYTLILEKLSNLNKFLAKGILEKAKSEGVEEKDLKGYIDSSIEIDREILKNLLK